MTSKKNNKNFCANLTFADVNIEKRKQALKEKNVVSFLEKLPEEIAKEIKDVFLAGDIKKFENSLSEKWFTENSEFFRRIVDRPSSERVFRVLYKHQPPLGVDSFFVECPAGQQIFSRLQSMEENLIKIIDKLISENPGRKIKVDNFFSGLGTEWVTILKKHENYKKHLDIRNVDDDPVVVENGRKLIKKENLDKHIKYDLIDFRRVKSRNADLVILVGVLCPLNQKIQSKILKLSHLFLNKKGRLITSVPTINMVNEDPFTDMMMRFAGWNMKYKTREMIKELGEANGWEEDGVFSDSKEFHYMVVFKPKRSFIKNIKIKMFSVIRKFV